MRAREHESAPYVTTGRGENLQHESAPYVTTGRGENLQSKRGTEIAAVFYTLLETAKLCGVDPARYLREAALADARGEVLLPHQLADATGA